MVGARGPRPGPEAAGLGNSAGRVTGPPAAQRYPGRGEVGRPRYLEDEGGPRPALISAEPPRPAPPVQIQLNASRAAERGAGAPGGARSTPGAGGFTAPRLAETPAEQARKAAA